MKPAQTTPDAPGTPDPHAQARLRLLDLAEDASLYLRRSAEPSVRVAAALLLAASLAACSAPSMTGSVATDDGPPAVAPLAQEVREGLPTSPGIYPVAPNGLTRDTQGVYGFSWRNNDGGTTWNQGRSSLMKLAQGTSDTLEIPASGDPILRLRPETAITLPDDDGPSATPTPGSGTSSSTTRSSSGSRSIMWYPFPSGGGTNIINSGGTGSGGASESVAATTPAYRNPPAADPGQGSVRGSSSSLAAPVASARTWTSPSRAAATGQSGGPGRGTAASSRSGASVGSSTASGAARPSSSSFSGGRSGASSSASSSSGG